MKKKGAKKKNEKGIDRLSNLPDALLLHILSFLPFKKSVNTMSLVSQRYHNLWEHLQVLNIDEKDFEDDEESFSYMLLYVNAFLARCKSCDIHKFRLSCDFEYQEDFFARYADMWIRTVIGPRLEELHLSLISDDSIKFPLNLRSSWPKLVSLTYVHNTPPLFYSASFNSFHILPTSLTTLCMPHSLKRLKLTSNNHIGLCLDLEIDALDLKYLSLTGITFEGSNIVNLHKVNEAYLDLVSLPRHGKNLLRALSKVKRLVLGGSTMKGNECVGVCVYICNLLS